MGQQIRTSPQSCHPPHPQLRMRKFKQRLVIYPKVQAPPQAAWHSCSFHPFPASLGCLHGTPKSNSSHPQEASSHTQTPCYSPNTIHIHPCRITEGTPSTPPHSTDDRTTLRSRVLPKAMELVMNPGRKFRCEEPTTCL